jgi:formimidoylglutamate deiminase
MEIWAENTLTADGWRRHMAITVKDGVIAGLHAEQPPRGHRVGTLLQAPANLHSHAFQRALAGLTETRTPSGFDSFWTWRQLMYRFLNQLTPDDVETITAFAQMEMLESGFASVGEFHYLHHRPDGMPYDDLGEMAGRIAAAASTTGIGLTLLPVLYQQGGPDGAPLGDGQRRFGCGIDQFERLFETSRTALKTLPADCGIGVAPHSLRAVTPQGLDAAIKIAGDRPIHMHLAEQQAEIDAVQAAYGTGPGAWLLDHAPVDKSWTLIHCTGLTSDEIAGIAKSGAVVGLCPITEASLGDGIFDLPTLLAHGGKFGVGTDSNIRISLAEELRLLEYGQRLRDRRRVICTAGESSAGASLFGGAAAGGAAALVRGSGGLCVGAPADLLALDETSPDLCGRQGDRHLDSLVFCGDNRMVSDLWAAGRHVVRGGQHFAHDMITTAYHNVMRRLTASL